ncbi:MAG TPA: DUF4037 domain-containing protein [Actinopolymorphaceae bacterium]
MDAQDSAVEIAHKVAEAYQELDGLAYAYAHGPVIAGFTNDSDLDVVVVWEDEIPRYRSPVLGRLHNGSGKPAQHDYPGLSFDRLRIGDQQVEVAHKNHKMVEGWIGDVQAGWGWEDSDSSMSLYSVAGLAYGRVFVGESRAAEVREELTPFPQLLVERTRAVLEAELPSYERDLTSAARRGDGLLFHELLSKVLRHALVTWFSAEHRYCPHPRWLQQWATRFGMDSRIAGLERSLWLPVTLERRRETFLTMAKRILDLKPSM